MSGLGDLIRRIGEPGPGWLAIGRVTRTGGGDMDDPANITYEGILFEVGPLRVRRQINVSGIPNRPWGDVRTKSQDGESVAYALVHSDLEGESLFSWFVTTESEGWGDCEASPPPLTLNIPPGMSEDAVARLMNIANAQRS